MFVRYRLIATLGKGTFGKVKLAVNVETNEKVAMKIIDKQQVLRQNMGPQVKKEISIMKQLKHPNVVQVKEVLASSTKIFIIMQYLSRGALRSEIVSRGLFGLRPCKMYFVIFLNRPLLLGGTLSEDEARKFFRQMVQGLQYVHSQGVCHRDLKVFS